MKKSGKIKTVVMMVLMCVAGITYAASDSFDAIPGGGEGWSGDWTMQNPIVQSVSLSSAFPVNEGGSYLNYQTITTGTNGVYRDFEGSIGSAAYTLTLDVRINSLGNFWTGPDLSDRIQIYGETGTGTNDAGATAGFIIMASPNYKTAPGGNWQVYNGRKNGAWSSSYMVNSGIPVVEGGIYTFTVTVDPVLFSYDITISDGTNIFTRTGLGYRSASTSPADRLVFANKIRTAAAGGTPIDISYDSVRIVPEPTTLALLGLGTLTTIYRRKCHK